MVRKEMKKLSVHDSSFFPMRTLLLIFLTLFTISVSVRLAQSSTTAIVSVSPSTITAPIDQNFNINVNISNVLDLYGWEFRLSWNATLLNTFSIVEGTFLKAGGSTFFYYNVNETAGHMVVDCTLLSANSGVSGDGILATITFHVKNVGQCLLDLYDVTLVNSLEQKIACQTLDGYSYFITHGDHDIAVVNVKPLKTVVGQNYCANIEVTIKNYGIFTENFNTTIYANTTSIATRAVTLTSGSSINITFTWNTSSFVKGKYVISAYAWPVQNETYIDNNRLTDGQVRVATPGDVNGDGIVNMQDIYKELTLRFMCQRGDAGYSANSDINDDGIINMQDIYIAILHFMQT
jgi:hypothetical protein